MGPTLPQHRYAYLVIMHWHCFFHTPEPQQIKLLLPLPGGAFFLSAFVLPTLALPFFLKLSLADYEISFFFCSLFDISCAPAILAGLPGLPCKEILDISGLMGLACAIKGQVFVCVKNAAQLHPSEKRTLSSYISLYYYCFDFRDLE